MRRALTMALSLLLVLSVSPAGAHESGQKVSGTIIGPPLPAKNVSRGGRSLVLISQMVGQNGIGGYYFTVKPETIGAPFVLKPMGGHDVDVWFYDSLGDLGNGAATITGEFAAEDATGEKGFVPEGTNTVVVYYGPCPACGAAPVAVPFEYDAEATPLVVIGGSLDLGSVEVHKGGSVRLDNTTGSPLTLTSDDLNGGDPLFSIGEGFTGKTLFSLGGLETGSYGYRLSNGARGTFVVV